MRIRNPFKTKVILFVTPAGTWKVELPFLGKTRKSVIPWKKIKGEKIDIVIVDELILNNKTEVKNNGK